MTVAKLVLLTLQLANMLLNWGREARQMQAGEDKAIAKAALAVAKNTEWGKAIEERIDALDDRELDALERDLERGVREL